MRYSITHKTETYTKSTKLNDRKYGGWMAVNVGTDLVRVLGYELQPSEGLNFLDAIPVGNIWEAPIDIVIPTANGAVRITRLLCREIKEKED